MKKLIYVLIALVVLGGVAFALTQTELLKGDVEQLVKEQEQVGGALQLADLDTDDDGLTDSLEADLHTDPNNPDTDGDGLPDGIEVNRLNTDPLLTDTDGGGVDDKTEMDSGTDPLDGTDDVAEAQQTPGGQAPSDNYTTVEISVVALNEDALSGLGTTNFIHSDVQGVSSSGTAYAVKILPSTDPADITVSVDGYVDAKVYKNPSTNAYFTIMYPGYLIGVMDGTTPITTATVKAGYDSSSMMTCTMVSDSLKYYACLLDTNSTGTAKYSVSADGYTDQKGEFTSTRTQNSDAVVSETISLATSGTTRQTELNEIQQSVDLKIDSVTYDNTNSTLVADVCLDGTLDAKIMGLTTDYNVSA